MSRRIGRILAFQALYSWDVSNTPLEELLSFSWIDNDKDFGNTPLKTDDGTEVEVGDASKIEPMMMAKDFSLEDKSYAHILIAGTIEHIEEIDKVIQDHSKTRIIERISRPTLAVLRLSIFSLLYQKEIDAKVTIDEAISISRDFCSADAYKFINGVLDAVSKEN